MTLKETFIENLSKITSGMKQKDIAKIMGCTEGTMSKYLNQSKTDFPTVEMLYNLAQHFNVSIDWLVGNSQDPRAKEKLSPREICKMLLSIYNSYMHFSFGQYTVTEDCYVSREYNGEFYGDTNHSTKNNTYIAMYFSEWAEFDNEDDLWMYAQTGNDMPSNACINKFLSRLKEITGMLKRGNLNQEMYDRLLESYLNDVPD